MSKKQKGKKGLKNLANELCELAAPVIYNPNFVNKTKLRKTIYSILKSNLGVSYNYYYHKAKGSDNIGDIIIDIIYLLHPQFNDSSDSYVELIQKYDIIIRPKLESYIFILAKTHGLRSINNFQDLLNEDYKYKIP